MSVEYFRVSRALNPKSQISSSAKASLTRFIAPVVGQPIEVAGYPTLIVEWMPGEGPSVTNGTWSNITQYCTLGRIERGRRYELDQFASGTLTLTLRATTRLFDPDNTVSTYYPNVVPMRQVRVRATYDSPNGLLLDGTTNCYIATPNTAALQISGDIDIRVKVAPSTWTPAAETKLLSKEGSNVGYALSIMPSGRLRFVYGASGALQIVDSTVNPTGVLPAVTTWVRVTRAVSSGAVMFYQSTDGDTWTQIGSPVVSAVGASIATSTDVMRIGASSNAGAPLLLTGRVYYADVRSGIGGTIVAQPNMEALGTSRPGSAPFVDIPGNTWTFTGTAIIPVVTLTYPLFYGYVTDWGQTVEADKVFFTTITAHDAFALLEMNELPSSAWALELQRTVPSLWFRLGETDTVRVTDSSAGGNYGLYDNVTQGAEGLVANDDDGAVNFGTDYDPADSRVTIQNPALITGYPFTLSFLLQIPPAPSYHRVVFAGLRNIVTFDPSLRIYIEYDHPGGFGAGRLVFALQNGSNFGLGYLGPIDDNNIHQVTLVVTSSGIDFYLDGVYSHSNANNAGWIGTVPSGYTIGNYTDTNWGAYGMRGVGDEVVVWNGAAIDSGTIARLATAATGWDGDNSGRRMDRFLDAIGWPVDMRFIYPGISVLGPAKWSAGQNALEVMQRWADTELGAFFIDTSGRIVWRNRHYAFLNGRATKPQVVFVDGNTASRGTLFAAEGFSLTRDETLIRNPVQAGRDGGVTVQVKDNAYVTKYGNRTWAAPVSEDANDAVMRDRATWLLNRYKELGTRLESMVVKPRRDPPNMWPKVLSLELGDMITIKRQPLGINNEIVTNQIIEAISHSFDASRQDWTTVYTASPADPSINTYLILDDPAFGRLDTFRLAY